MCVLIYMASNPQLNMYFLIVHSEDKYRGKKHRQIQSRRTIDYINHSMQLVLIYRSWKKENHSWLRRDLKSKCKDWQNILSISLSVPTLLPNRHLLQINIISIIKWTKTFITLALRRLRRCGFQLIGPMDTACSCN